MDHESARNKAMRRWHNNYVNHSAKPQYTEDEKQILRHEPPTSIAREILSIIRQKNSDMMLNYMISIEARRRSLLREKLRRLKENVSNQDE
jgi:hypothetical protein